MDDNEKNDDEPWGDGPDVPPLSDAKDPLADDEDGGADDEGETRKWVPPIP